MSMVGKTRLTMMAHGRLVKRKTKKTSSARLVHKIMATGVVATHKHKLGQEAKPVLMAVLGYAHVLHVDCADETANLPASHEEQLDWPCLL